MLTLAASVGAVSAPVALRRPSWAVFLFAFLFYGNLSYVLAHHHDFKPTNYLLAAAAGGLLLAYKLLHGDSHLGSGKFLFVVALWLAGALLSLLMSASPTATGWELVRVMSADLVLSSFLFLLVTDFDRFRAALYGMVAAMLAAATLTGLQHLLGLEGDTFAGFANGSVEQIAGAVNAWRPAGPISDPNYYAQTLLPALAIVIDRAIRRGVGASRVLAIAAAAVILTAIILTASRGAMVAVACIAALFFFRQQKFPHLIVIAVVVPLVALIALPSHVERIVGGIVSVIRLATDGGGGGVDVAVSGRFNEMAVAVILFLESPLTGIGYGQFEQYYQPVSVRYDLLIRSLDRQAHSLYLETAAEQGALGLLILTVILAMAAAAVLKARRILIHADRHRLADLVSAFGIGAVGFFIAATFLHGAFPRYMWFVIAMCFAAEKLAVQLPTNDRSRV